MKSTTTPEATTMSYSMQLGDAVKAIAHKHVSSDAANRVGDMAEAMATVRPHIEHRAICQSVLAYLDTAGYVGDAEGDDLLAALLNHTPQR